MSDFYFRNKREYVDSIIDAVVEIDSRGIEEATTLIEQSGEVVDNGFKLRISAENMAAHLLGIHHCMLS